MLGCALLFFFVIGLSGLCNCLLFFPLGLVWGLPMMVVGLVPFFLLITGKVKP